MQGFDESGLPLALGCARSPLRLRTHRGQTASLIPSVITRLRHSGTISRVFMSRCQMTKTASFPSTDPSSSWTVNPSLPDSWGRRAILQDFRRFNCVLPPPRRLFWSGAKLARPWLLTPQLRRFASGMIRVATSAALALSHSSKFRLWLVGFYPYSVPESERKITWHSSPIIASNAPNAIEMRAPSRLRNCRSSKKSPSNAKRSGIGAVCPGRRSETYRNPEGAIEARVVLGQARSEVRVRQVRRWRREASIACARRAPDCKISVSGPSMSRGWRRRKPLLFSFLAYRSLGEVPAGSTPTSDTPISLHHHPFSRFARLRASPSQQPITGARTGNLADARV